EVRALVNGADSTQSSHLLVFKNTARVESVFRANGWNLINPPATLSEKIENKISQIRWLGDLGAQYLPPHAIKLAKDIMWRNDPFILQWAHGHTGGGTVLISSPVELRSIQEQFPERLARISEYIHGPSFTVNVLVTETGVVMGNVSYQITGMEPFTDNAFSTVGNDWGIAHSLLSLE